MRESKHYLRFGRGSEASKLERDLTLSLSTGLILVPICFAGIAGIITNADKIDMFFEKVLSWSLHVNFYIWLTVFLVSYSSLMYILFKKKV